MKRRAVSAGLTLVSVVVLAFPLPARKPAQAATPESKIVEAAFEPRPDSPLVGRNPQVQGYTLSPEKYARAVAYHRGNYWLYLVTTLYGLLLLWAMVRWRLAPGLRDWAEGISRRAWVQFLIGAPLLLLGYSVLLLPTDIFSQWNMRKYGASIQGWGSWFGDWAAGEAATLVAGTVTVGLLYFLMRRSPRRWWLYLWAIVVPLLVLIAFIQPIAIDPLFNTVEPLNRSNPELVHSIETLLGRAGLAIPQEHLYRVETSDKSPRIDAYSEGFGPTKSIFVLDTQIASEAGPAILHTLGHEIGHFKLPLDWIAFAICLPLSLALFYLIDRVFAAVLVHWGQEWNIRSPGDWASFPVLALMVAIVTVFLTPLLNTVSRYREHEADRYGLELIHGMVPNAGEMAANAFQKDEEINLADPDPPRIVRWWLFDHPPVNDRILFLRTYDPWSNHQRPRYVQ
jgi:STE24 endopeptidase